MIRTMSQDLVETVADIFSVSIQLQNGDYSLVV
jgi:hypothetical protein